MTKKKITKRTASPKAKQKQPNIMNFLKDHKRLIPAVAILSFALVGSYLLFISSAATVSLARVESEFMSLPAGSSIIAEGTASGGKLVLMSSNGTVSGSFATDSPITNMTIRAKGNQCQGAPQMVIKVDGIQSQPIDVSSTSLADYTNAVNLPSGNHTLSISYINDYSYNSRKNRKSCNRNLYIDVAVIQGTTADPVPPPDSSVTFQNVFNISSIGQFNGGVNTNSGTLTDISSPEDPKITMRGVVTTGGSTYARGIIDKNIDGTRISLGEGKELSISMSVIFRDTGRYESVVRFDNYEPYLSDGSLLGISRYNDDSLHLVANQYNATGAGLDIAAPNFKLIPNVRYDLKMEAKLSSVNGSGYSRFYINGNLVAQSTAANNWQNRSFTRLRAGVVAVGDLPASADIGTLTVAY